MTRAGVPRRHRPRAGPLLRRLLGVPAAVLLSFGLLLVPPTAGPVAAATGRLLVSADATYTLVPADRAIHVAIAVRLQNDKPSSRSAFYYWRDLTWPVQPEAARLHVSDAHGPLPSSTKVGTGSMNVSFRLSSDLLYGQVATVAIVFDLPDGGPRTASPVRVGAAFAAFDLWAWGDAGAGSVTVRMPSRYVPDLAGSPMEVTTSGDTTTLTTGVLASPVDFWASVSARDDARMASEALTLGGGISLVVRAWPEDGVWRTTTATILSQGLPELLTRIGLPWPLEKQLVVSEVYAPDLGGYAGIYSTKDESIQISEQIDNLTIVHEASHAWFNDALFSDRWIDEGLANTYAAAVVKAIGLTADSPSPPTPGDAGFVALASWATKPTRVTPEVEATETYGYNASWWVVQQIVAGIGEAGMRKVFAAAAANQTAYPGAGTPEIVEPSDNWQRFLDLVDGLGGSTNADDLVRSWVLTPIQAQMLDRRSSARAAYADLMVRGDGWAAPLAVRTAMGLWAFDRATAAIAAADVVLRLRDEVRSAAGALGVTPGPALEGSYETASDQLDAATALARGELGALGTMSRARQAVSAPADLLASIGLIGADPELGWSAAVAAFEADDIAAARIDAEATIVLMSGAAGTGRERVLIAGAAVLIAGGTALLIVRRRRRRSAPEANPRPVGTEAPEPYGTLAAEPPAEPGASGIAPAEEDVGGAADRGGPAPES